MYYYYGSYEGEIEVRDVYFSVVAQITIPVSGTGEVLEFEANFDYIGIISETPKGDTVAEVPDAMLDSFLANGDRPGPSTWRLLIENKVYEAIDREHAWEKEDCGLDD